MQNSDSSLSCGATGRKMVVSKPTVKKRNEEAGSLRTLSDKELEKMTTKQLNEYTRHIPSQQAQKLKKRRRILKNRRYALKCRLKSIQKRKTTIEENQSLENELSATRTDLKVILKERDYYRSKCVQLYSDVFERFYPSNSTKSGKFSPWRMYPYSNWVGFTWW